MSKESAKRILEKPVEDVAKIEGSTHGQRQKENSIEFVSEKIRKHCVDDPFEQDIAAASNAAKTTENTFEQILQPIKKPSNTNFFFVEDMPQTNNGKDNLAAPSLKLKKKHEDYKLLKKNGTYSDLIYFTPAKFQKADLIHFTPAKYQEADLMCFTPAIYEETIREEKEASTLNSKGTFTENKGLLNSELLTLPGPTPTKIMFCHQDDTFQDDEKCKVIESKLTDEDNLKDSDIPVSQKAQLNVNMTPTKWPGILPIIKIEEEQENETLLSLSPYELPHQTEKPEMPRQSIIPPECQGHTDFKFNLDVQTFSFPNYTEPSQSKENVIQPHIQQTKPLLAEARKEITAQPKSSGTENKDIKKKANKTILKGVRTNRRFELQMQKKQS